MLDVPIHEQRIYEPPALVLLGAIPDIAAELEKFGASLLPSGPAAYVPGDPVDWSLGRIS